MRPVEITRWIGVGAPQSEVFACVTGAEPASLFKRSGLLPGIAETEGAAHWSALGDERTHTLDDGGVLHETLGAYVNDEMFAYRVTGFSGLFGALIAEAHGEWRFEWRGPEMTQIAWTYRFTPVSGPARLALKAAAGLLFPGYMKNALFRIKDRIETRRAP